MPVPPEVDNAISSGAVRTALEHYFGSNSPVVEWVMDAIFLREHRNSPRRR